ncbi:chain length determinant protein [Streptomyces sp. NPDC020917]|uniref:chain length determinant protein n=1 Tax=Streptomyces sp. NPDC020917 TaxID=3365102 RepID=UPI0037B2051D
MDLAEIARVMRRRWYVLLPGVLLTVALTAGAYLKVPVTYTSQSTVVLLNSQKATKAFDGNPFLSSQISLNGMADSLARNLNSDAAVAHLKAQGATAATTAKLADNAVGPLLWLTASGTDKRAVLAADKLFTAYAAERLEQFQTQQSVTSQAMIRMATIVPPQNPVAQTKTRYEYLALAAVAGVVVSLVATFYVEARRRTPATEGAGREPDAAVPDGGQDEDGEAGRATGKHAAAAGPERSSAALSRKAPSWSLPGGLDRDALEVGALQPDPPDDPSDPGAPGTALTSGGPGASGASGSGGTHAAETTGMGDVTGVHGADAAGTDAHRFV